MLNPQKAQSDGIAWEFLTSLFALEARSATLLATDVTRCRNCIDSPALYQKTVPISRAITRWRELAALSYYRAISLLCWSINIYNWTE